MSQPADISLGARRPEIVVRCDTEGIVPRVDIGPEAECCLSGGFVLGDGVIVLIPDVPTLMERTMRRL